MTETTWKAFSTVRDEYRRYTENLSAGLAELRRAQQALVDAREGGAFAVETPVVYNRDLDDLGRERKIKLILVADNPGRREQAAENRRYLVGPSGKLADSFFRSHPELGMEFRSNVLILNKTPIHTPRTVELKELGRLGGETVRTAIAESQWTMARLIRRFRDVLGADGTTVPVWIIGYSEMARGKLFQAFTEALEREWPPGDSARDEVFLFRHFSMNQFTVDLRKRRLEGETVPAALERIGAEYRTRILGW